MTLVLTWPAVLCDLPQPTTLELILPWPNQPGLQRAHSSPCTARGQCDSSQAELLQKARPCLFSFVPSSLTLPVQPPNLWDIWDIYLYILPHSI